MLLSRKRLRKGLRRIILMATINDVARKAGVSITTVSYVITGKRFVSEDLKERVRQVMKETGYRPNNLARSLRLGKTDTIGLVIPDSSNLFFAEISHNIEDNGFKNGYAVFLCNSDDQLVKQTEYLDVLVSKQVDGIVFISVSNDRNNLDKLIDANIPFVIVDREEEDTLADVVLVDNLAGGRAAVQHLIDLGHKKIGCITGPSEANPSAERYQGYLKGMKENEIPVRDEYIQSGNFRYKSGEVAMEKLLALVDPPTAVFVCNDMMAIGAFRAIQNRGLKIPEDISIVGFDNIPIVEAITPALTTIAQPMKEIAERTMSILYKRMQGDLKGPFERVVLVPKLIIRNSTKALL